MRLLSPINESPLRVTSELPSGVTAPVVKPPAVTSWVWVIPGITTEYMTMGDGTWSSPIPAGAPGAATKGCVMLMVYDAPGTDDFAVKVFVHDGTNWKDNQGLGLTIQKDTRPGLPEENPEIIGWYSGPTADADAKARLQESMAMHGDCVVFAALADGIHVYDLDETQTEQDFTIAYPACGVADMPPSKTF